MGKAYTQEELDFIKEYATKLTYRELAELTTKTFGVKRTRNSMMGICKKYGFVKMQVEYYSKEDDEYILSHYKELSYRELGEALGKNAEAVRNHCMTLGIRCENGNRNRRKAGKHSPIGHEIVYGSNKDVYVKVKDDFCGTSTSLSMKNYRRKKDIIWENAKGEPIPKGYVIIFADGDKNNFDPNNLWAVPRGIVGKMNKRNWQFEDCPEFRKAAIRCCELEAITK